MHLPWRSVHVSICKLTNDQIWLPCSCMQVALPPRTVRILKYMYHALQVRIHPPTNQRTSVLKQPQHSSFPRPPNGRSMDGIHAQPLSGRWIGSRHHRPYGVDFGLGKSSWVTSIHLLLDSEPIPSAPWQTWPRMELFRFSGPFCGTGTEILPITVLLPTTYSRC